MSNTLSPISPENMDGILATIEAQYAESTRRDYGEQVKLRDRFYRSHGWDTYPKLEAGDLDGKRFVVQALSWLQKLNDEGKSKGTLGKALSAFKWDASKHSMEAEALLSSRPVKAFMEGAVRQRKDRVQRKAQALTLDTLRLLYRYMNSNPSLKTTRDKAIIAVGIATAFRASNLGDLTLADVSSSVTRAGLTITARHSKTDQHGNGHSVAVLPYKGERLLDPVAALNDWLGVLASRGFTKQETPNFPLFPTIRGYRSITGEAVKNAHLMISDLLRHYLVLSGAATEEEVRAYSSHSLRATFITLSFSAGVAERDIAAISDHKSNAIRGYDRRSIEAHAQVAYLGGSTAIEEA
jgi:integrase